MRIFLVLIICWEIALNAAQKDPNFTANRQIIVHLFEWKWGDIADECERFLQYNGYGGIQISPPNEYIIATNRPWWERYQPVSYNLTTRSGTEPEFTNMLARCNQVGIRIYADVVFNHMAALTGTGTAGNTALSDVKTYPAVPFNPEHFHPTCNITNYLNPEIVRNCELNQLRDLDQSNLYVQDKIVQYLNKLIYLGVAGFRIDSAKYIAPTDLQNIYAQLDDLNTNFGFAPGSRPFLLQDVPVFDNDVVEVDEYTPLGVVTEYRHSQVLGRIFNAGKNLTSLENWGLDWMESQDALVFVDSHITQRSAGILTYKDLRPYKIAVAFMLAYNYGIPRLISSYFFTIKDTGPPEDTDENIKSPIIYSDGSCGNGYVCEHRWPQIVNMVQFRNIVVGSKVENWWSDGESIAFSRGSKGFAAFCNGGDLNANITTSLPVGIYCDVISGGLVGGTCQGKTVEVDAEGVASVSILAKDYDGVLAIHIQSKLS